MSDQKIFAGPRIKRFRTSLDLSQTAMAKALDISPSYLNLVERNQRPLTVQLILKLSKVYNLSPEDLDGGADGIVTNLKQVFADSLLEGELPGYEELFEVADAAPNVANGILKLHAGYRNLLTRLSDLNTLIAQQGTDVTTSNSLPHDQVRAALEDHPNYYDTLDRACETLSADISFDRGLWAGLTDWLLATHHVRVQLLPVDVMPDWRSRYDKHSQRLFISDTLSAPDQIEALATHVALFGLSDDLDRAALRAGLTLPEELALVRLYMARYAAHALMMPYGKFHQIATRIKGDVVALANRFSVSFAQAAFRLTSLGRTDAKGLAWAMLTLHPSGAPRDRLGVIGFPKSDFGGRCGRLDVFQPVIGQRTPVVSEVELGSDRSFITVTQRAENGQSVMLILDAKHREKTIYTRTDDPKIEAGVNCRLCERAHCADRHDAPLTKPLALDETAFSVSDFDFKI